MDVIRFQRKRLKFPEFDVVEVLINDTPLVELVRRYELPLATAEGRPQSAGDYGSLEASVAAPPSRHFLGEPTYGSYRHGERTQVLLCDADYEPGCKPFVCRIDVLADHVVWSSFRQPGDPWSYDGFGPFEFDRVQYEKALAALPSGPPW